jgi:hypothetical protein
MTLAVDNVLKFLIAGLVSILAWNATNMHGSVKDLERKMTGIEVSLAELRNDIKHISKANGTGF